MPIEMKHISKTFGDTRALDDVTLTFGDNKIYGLLGNNGAGKSTLLGILTGRLYPTQGEVTVDGEGTVNNDAALRKMYLVAEKNMFPEDMRVKAAFKAAQLFYPEFDAAYAEALAGKFGLPQKKKIKSLSTGYGSIFRLILGLSVGVPYLFFDEPVLGLDAQHRDMFYRELLARYAERPCTLIVSTHLIAEAADLIEHAVIIRNGKILKDAPRDELTADAYTVSGPAGAIDKYIEGRHVLTTSTLGGLRTASLQGERGPLPEGVEATLINLQDYFICLMEEEDRK